LITKEFIEENIDAIDIKLEIIDIRNIRENTKLDLLMCNLEVKLLMK
jgi:hypothetical protein